MKNEIHGVDQGMNIFSGLVVNCIGYHWQE